MIAVYNMPHICYTLTPTDVVQQSEDIGGIGIKIITSFSNRSRTKSGCFTMSNPSAGVVLFSFI